jgi:NADP-dependent 3-hydroxy acid dehydrogenase YdfG
MKQTILLTGTSLGVNKATAKPFVKKVSRVIATMCTNIA